MMRNDSSRKTASIANRMKHMWILAHGLSKRAPSAGSCRRSISPQKRRTIVSAISVRMLAPLAVMSVRTFFSPAYTYHILLMFLTIDISDGTSKTTNIDGKMKKTRGKIILTGASIALALTY